MRRKSLGLSARLSEDGESLDKAVAQGAKIIIGLLLAGRALALPPVSSSLPLHILRVVLALALSAWGILCLFEVFRPSPSRLSAWISGDARSVLLLAWSSATSTVDVLAGAGPAIFVAGVAYAAVIGWDRMRRFTALTVGGFALVALGCAAPLAFRTGPLRVEELLAAALAAGAAIAVARTTKSFVAPGRERLRSLERENKQLWDLSFRDTLTGLYNRRFAQETGRTLIARARRYHEQLHVFMLDIDHFKKVNDQLSHAVGDEVLKGIAQAIQSCLRTSDSVSRYGGEEFLAFVVQAEAEVAQFIANRIRDAVAAKRFEGVPWKITISIGVASAQDDDDLETLVDRADKYLYTSKRSGRNRVSGF